MCADDVVPINISSMWNAQLYCHQQKLFWLWGLYLRSSRPSLVSPYKRKPGHFRPSLLAFRIQLLLLFSAITTLNLGKTKRSLNMRLWVMNSLMNTYIVVVTLNGWVFWKNTFCLLFSQVWEAYH